MRQNRHEIVIVAFWLTAILASFLIITVTNAYPMSYEDKYIESWISEILLLESSHGKNLHGQHGEYGVAQFKYESFEWLKQKAKMEWLDWEDNTDQVALLEWCLRNGYSNHWTTAKKAEQQAVIKRYRAKARN